MKKLIIFLFLLNILCINAYAEIGYMLNTKVDPLASGGIVGTPNSNTTFESNGFQILTGNAMGWDDVAYQNIFSAKLTGTGTLALATITGNIQGYAFSINDYVMISAEMAHKWKIGTPVSIHCHVLNKSVNAADRFMKFTLEYTWVDVNTGLTTAPATVSNNFTVPANAPLNTGYYVELTNVTPPISIVSGHILGKLTRVAATGTEVANDPIVISFGVHGRVDSLGSRQEYLK